MNSTNTSWDIAIVVVTVPLNLKVIVVVIVVVQIVHHTPNVLIHKVKSILIIDLIEILVDKIIILIQLKETKEKKDKEEIQKGILIMIETLTMTRGMIDIITTEIIKRISIKSKIRIWIRAMTLITVGIEVFLPNQIHPKVL